MINRNLKELIKKIPIIWKLLVCVKDYLIKLSRLKDVIIMMILFHVWPEQVYRFSTRKYLPSKKNRLPKELKSTIPYDLLRSQSTKISMIKEVNLISLGKSFDLKNLDKINGPIFFVSFWFPININNNGEIIYKHPNDWEKGFSRNYTNLYWQNINKDTQTEEFSNMFANFKDSKTFKEFKKEEVTYIISRKSALLHFKKNGNRILSVEVYRKNKDGNYYPSTEVYKTEEFRKIFNDENSMYISIAEKIYKPSLLAPNEKEAPTGSFLPALCALSFVAEKINVYGWDFYLESSPENMNYWELFFNMYKYQNDVTRSKNHFESALINFYYAHQLSKLPNIHIHGYMGKLNKHEKLIKRIERVLFN